MLCADLALQRLRFHLWGETVGLVSRGPLTPPNPLPALGDPEIRPTVIQVLQAIQYLLQEANRVRDQFSSPPRSPHQMTLFRDTFNHFRLRAYLSRKQASVATVTKWAVYGREEFQGRIERLKSLIDGLQKVLELLGVRQTQRRKLQTPSRRMWRWFLHGKKLGEQRCIALREISPDASVEDGVLQSQISTYRGRYGRSLVAHG